MIVRFVGSVDVAQLFGTAERIIALLGGVDNGVQFWHIWINNVSKYRCVASPQLSSIELIANSVIEKEIYAQKYR